MRSVRLLVGLAILGLIAAASARGQALEAVDEGRYRSFFTIQDRSERIRVFNAMPAEEKVRLMNTHVRRWLVANVDSLNGGQIAVIGEALTTLTPEVTSQSGDMGNTFLRIHASPPQ